MSYHITPITIIKGLHRRFPVVWSNRDQYPFYKHMIFQRPLFQDEYRLNFAYCLFEASNQDEALFVVLFNELYKKESKVYRELKKIWSK